MNSETNETLEKSPPRKATSTGFSLRQAFSLTNLVILLVGSVFSFIIIGLLLRSKRDETQLRLANQAEVARREVDQVFQDASDTATALAEAFPLILKLPQKEFEHWLDRYSDSLLASKPAFFDVCIGFAPDSARAMYKTSEMVYWIFKDPELVEDKRFNDPSTFAKRKKSGSGYLSDPKEIWYHQAIDSQDVSFTPMWFDRTYTNRVMISVSKASRDLKTGKLLAVTGVDITPGSFSRLLRGFRIGKSGGVLILDQSGAPLAPFLGHDVPMIGYQYNPRFDVSSDFPLFVRGAPTFSREDGIHEMNGADGERYLYEVRKVIGRPYYVVSYQRKAEAYASLYWTIGTLILLAFTFLSVSLFLRQRLANFVVGNIQTILWNIELNREVFSRSEPDTHIGRLDPKGPKEVARISEQLNLLYERLEKAFSEVRTAKERAELATKTKSRFLSVMSHEIRTPLNSMLGLTDVLLLSPLNSEQVRHLRILQRSGQSLLRILNDILDFSRLEAGKLVIEPNEFDLFELLYDVESLMRYDAEAKGLQFRITAPTYNFRLIGDAIRIRQALLNLVGNAVKFTAEGTIDVRVTAIQNPARDVQKFQFEVADSGIGMSDEAQAKIFSEFSQADASITRRYGGTGLGLVICRQIVSLLDGELTLESETGKGTTCQFTIPLRVVSQVKTQYHEITGDRTGTPLSQATPTSGSKALKPDTRVRAAEIAPAVPPTENTESISDAVSKDFPIVLAVDDDEDNHRLLDAYMKFRTNLRMEHAFSGAEAIEKMKKFRVALVLMDMQMPEMDGLDTIQAIRKLQSSGVIPSCPIIMLSANTFAEDQQKSIEAGAEEHIGKPIKLERFNEILNRWIP